MSNRVLTYEDLQKISALLTEAGYNNCGLTVEMKVATPEMMRKINEDYLYRFGCEKNEDAEKIPTQVNINVGSGISFVYRLEAENG